MNHETLMNTNEDIQHLEGIRQRILQIEATPGNKIWLDKACSDIGEAIQALKNLERGEQKGGNWEWYDKHFYPDE